MDKHTAEVMAKDLQSQMTTPGWEPRVWENLGWHYTVVKGNAEIMPGRSGYHIYFSTAGRCGSDVFWHVSPNFDDPNDAVKAQIEKANEFIAKCQAAVATIA